MKKNIHFLCIDMASPQYECAHVSLSKYSLKTLFHTSNIGMASSQYECAHACLSSYSLTGLFHTLDKCMYSTQKIYIFLLCLKKNTSKATWSDPRKDAALLFGQPLGQFYRMSHTKHIAAILVKPK